MRLVRPSFQCYPRPLDLCAERRLFAYSVAALRGVAPPGVLTEAPSPKLPFFIYFLFFLHRNVNRRVVHRTLTPATGRSLSLELQNPSRLLGSSATGRERAARGAPEARVYGSPGRHIQSGRSIRCWSPIGRHVTGVAKVKSQ